MITASASPILHFSGAFLLYKQLITSLACNISNSIGSKKDIELYELKR